MTREYNEMEDNDDLLDDLSPTDRLHRVERVVRSIKERDQTFWATHWKGLTDRLKDVEDKVNDAVAAVSGVEATVASMTDEVKSTRKVMTWMIAANIVVTLAMVFTLAGAMGLRAYGSYKGGVLDISPVPASGARR